MSRDYYQLYSGSLFDPNIVKNLINLGFPPDLWRNNTIQPQEKWNETIWPEMTGQWRLYSAIFNMWVGNESERAAARAHLAAKFHTRELSPGEYLKKLK